MKRAIFQFLSMLNRILLPRYSKRDLNKLSKVDQAIIAYRYWVTLHSLD
jgi:hypothetical protein